MTQARFVSQIAMARELCQLDNNGKVIPRDKQTKFRLEITTECSTDDKIIDIEFLIRTEVPLARLNALASDRERAATVAFLVAKDCIPKLVKQGHLEIYRGIQARIEGEEMLSNVEEVYDHKENHILNEHLAKQLSEATSKHRASAKKFEDAKKYLERNLDSLRHDPIRARQCAHFLADCMQNSGTPFMSGWNREYAARLVGNVNDLIKRKNSSHPGYSRSADAIETILYQISPEKLWFKEPL
ncbi:MAG: hypothetical protein OJI67_24465 [Prosthecobacter sp.]|nr:hypothetical protein [Prosthecobacter sp.]